MRSTELQQRIKKLEVELADARKAEADLSSGSPTAVADFLHSKLCHWNHTDGCGWEYESWEAPRDARNEYLAKANNFISLCEDLGVPLQKAIEIVRSL